jgi:hypothetical protein
MDLEAIEEIKRLKYRYFRTLDLKDWEGFGDCLTTDIRARYGTHAMPEPVHFDDREGVVAFMSENLTPAVITVHVAHHPEIEVDGDEAIGSWCFEDTVIVPELQTQIRGAGYYTDAYHKDSDGAWRISSTGYERIYEAMTSLADTPSFALLTHRWGSDQAT